MSRQSGSSLLHIAATVIGTAAAFAANTVGAAQRACCPVVELRQYTLKPDRFEPFNALFEREFIESQEADGATVIGQFHDLDDSGRFVWLRGFSDMARRREMLEAFYGGALWKSLRDEANANFIDTDNVLLLRPPSASDGFRLGGLERAARGAAPAPAGYFTATIYAVNKDDAAAFPRWFAQTLRPVLVKAGIEPAAVLETNPAVNDFPRLPVREGETVFIWFARFTDRAQGEEAVRRLAASPAWRNVAPALAQRLSKEPQVLRLEPTARSLLR